MELAKRIEQLRKKNGLSQEQLGPLLDPRWLRRWLSKE